MFIESRLRSVPGQESSDTLAVCFSEDIGLGIQALVDAPAGAVLDNFTGEITHEITQHSLQIRPGVHIARTRFIGFLSHGCEPNCRLDMDRFELVAVRDIRAGELITIDYAATEEVLHVQFACHCGAESCRQWITGSNDPVNSAGLAYLAAMPKPVHHL